MKLVLASNNVKKLKELDAILAPLGWELVPQGQLGVPEAEEPHCTFVENALAKARHASRLTGLPALADDSGPVSYTHLDVYKRQVLHRAPAVAGRLFDRLRGHRQS